MIRTERGGRVGLVTPTRLRSNALDDASMDAFGETLSGFDAVHDRDAVGSPDFDGDVPEAVERVS